MENSQWLPGTGRGQAEGRKDYKGKLFGAEGYVVVFTGVMIVS